MRRLVSYRTQFGFIATITVIYLSKDQMYHKQMKHINVRYHKLHQWVMDNKVIDLVKISTKKILADTMTKTILVEKFRASLNFIKVL